MQKTLNKKAAIQIALSTLVGIVIGVISFLAFLGIASNFVQLNSKFLDDYGELADWIRISANSPEKELTDNKIIMLDKDSAIVFFEKGRTLLFEANAGQSAGEGSWSQSYYAEVQKPQNNKCQDSCICLCKGLNFNWLDDKNSNLNFDNCKECQSLDIKSAPSRSQCSISEAGDGCISSYLNGFILGRDIKLKKMLLIEKDIKEATIYIHKYKDYIALCKIEPCIDENTKKILDFSDNLEKEFKKCESGQIPEGNNTCSCSSIDMANFPQNFKLQLQGSAVQKIKIFPLSGLHLFEIRLSSSLMIYNIDEDKREYTADLELRKDSADFIFKDILNQDSLALIKYKAGDINHTALAKYNPAVSPDGWKSTKTNLIRVTRNIDNIKEIPLCI